MAIKEKIRLFAVRAAKRFPQVRPWLRGIRRVTLSWLYAVRFCVGSPVRRNVILFESFMGRYYSDNPRAVYEYMLTDPRFEGYTFVWAFREPEKMAEELPVLKRAELVRYQSGEYYKYCAMAGAWVSNSRLPDWLVRRKGQQYLQTWHGTPLKRLAYDISGGNNAMNSPKELRRKYDIDSRRYTDLLSASPFVSEKFMSAFALKKLGQEGIIREIGSPRNDRLVRAKGQDTAARKAALGIPADKKVILYAPTWRDNQHDAKTGYVYATELDFAALRKAIGEEYAVLFRAHYHVSNGFDFSAHQGFVIDASREQDIAELYLAADLLITDYSSVFFDYAILERPILFYMYDLEKYRDELRGFYISPEELPGPISTTTEQLAADILQAKSGSAAAPEKSEAFRQKFIALEDGDASRRAAELIIAHGGRI